MLFKMEKEGARKKAAMVLASTGARMSDAEQERLQVEDYGTDNLKVIGSQRLVYVSNEALYAAEVVLFPKQIRPELRHPKRDVTIRCREGKVYLYTEGDRMGELKAKLPKNSEGHFSVFHEIVLEPGMQLDIPANTRYWMQGSAESGGVYLELSGPYDARQDIFTSAAHSIRG